MRPSLIMSNVVCAITLLLVLGMFTAAAHGQEQSQQLLVSAPSTSQAQPLLAAKCVPHATLLLCQLTSANVDELAGYDDVVVLSHTTFLSAIQR